MMLSDGEKTDFDSKRDAKSGNDSELLDLSDPASIEKLKLMAG